MKLIVDCDVIQRLCRNYIWSYNGVIGYKTFHYWEHLLDLDFYLMELRQ